MTLLLGVRGRVGRVRCRSRDRLQRLRRSDGCATQLVGDRIAAGETLGVESTCPHSVLQLLAEARGKAEPVVVVDDVINRLRLIKSPAEMRAARAHVQIIEQSAARALRDPAHRHVAARPDAGRQGAHDAQRRGRHQPLTFSFASANPEFAIHEPLERGSLVTLDLGGDLRGLLLRQPALRLWRGRAGVAAGAVRGDGRDRRCGGSGARARRDLRLALPARARSFAGHGIELLTRFTHTGHNIGLETEEEWLDDSDDPAVEAGMVISIELYYEGRDGRADRRRGDLRDRGIGPRRISVLPREIHVVGAPSRERGGRFASASIGLGMISRAHLAGYAAAEDAEVVAVCDEDPAKVEAVAAAHGARGSTDYRALLADPMWMRSTCCCRMRCTSRSRRRRSRPASTCASRSR